MLTLIVQTCGEKVADAERREEEFQAALDQEKANVQSEGKRFSSEWDKVTARINDAASMTEACKRNADTQTDLAVADVDRLARECNARGKYQARTKAALEPAGTLPRSIMPALLQTAQPPSKGGLGAYVLGLTYRVASEIVRRSSTGCGCIYHTIGRGEG